MGFLKLIISSFILLVCLNEFQVTILGDISADASFIGACMLLAGFIAHSDKD